MTCQEFRGEIPSICTRTQELFVAQCDNHVNGYKCIPITDYLFINVSESTVDIVEGPRSEQSEPILQREPLYGPVGTHHQPT